MQDQIAVNQKKMSVTIAVSAEEKCFQSFFIQYQDILLS